MGHSDQVIFLFATQTIDHLNVLLPRSWNVLNVLITPFTRFPDPQGYNTPNKFLICFHVNRRVFSPLIVTFSKCFLCSIPYIIEQRYL